MDRRIGGIEMKKTKMEMEKMRILEDKSFPLMPGKVKIKQVYEINWQFHRCFTLTSTMFF